MKDNDKSGAFDRQGEEEKRMQSFNKENAKKGLYLKDQGRDGRTGSHRNRIAER